MEKEKLIEFLCASIDNLYKFDGVLFEDLDLIEKNLNEISNYLKEDKLYREILILIKTAKLAKGERLEHLKIAIISDLELEVKKLNLLE